jgi:hypothetical protein
MPSGRDSFRRNRVAPICYDSLRPYYITHPKSHVAAQGLGRHMSQLIAIQRTVDRVARDRRNF